MVPTTPHSSQNTGKNPLGTQKGWDSEIPQNLHLTAQTTLTELEHCPGVKWPKQLSTLPFTTQTTQLHMFVDASNTAYAAVAYMRLVDNSSKQIQVQFRIGKARITPSRPMTIPKLELLAGLIGSRLIKFILLAIPNKSFETFLWSDSKCVLQWLKQEKLLPQFVSNQVKEINQLKNITFRYVPSKENPADIGSRGSTFQQLQESLWWTGPPWLNQEEENWPIQDNSHSTEETAQQPIFTIFSETWDSNPHSRNDKNFLLIGKNFANRRYRRQMASSTAHIPRFHKNTLTILAEKKVLIPTFAIFRTLQDSFSNILLPPENTPYGVKLENYSKLYTLIRAIVAVQPTFQKYSNTLRKRLKKSPLFLKLQRWNYETALTLLIYADQQSITQSFSTNCKMTHHTQRQYFWGEPIYKGLKRTPL